MEGLHCKEAVGVAEAAALGMPVTLELMLAEAGFVQSHDFPTEHARMHAFTHARTNHQIGSGQVRRCALEQPSLSLQQPHAQETHD